MKTLKKNDIVYAVVAGLVAAATVILLSSCEAGTPARTYQPPSKAAWLKPVEGAAGAAEGAYPTFNSAAREPQFMLIPCGPEYLGSQVTRFVDCDARIVCVVDHEHVAACFRVNGGNISSP